MKRFLDASVLVEACLAQSSKFSAADALVKAGEAVTSAHALAEAYATLSGDARLKLHPQDAAQMVGELAAVLDVHALSAEQYLSLIQSAPVRGIRGGSFFDALHAQAARDSHCAEIHTLNVRHFQHVAPDLTVRGLSG
jgi:predicted nucleic acid-binding protein